MQVKFWGVRGSIAVSGPAFAATGGNTACITVESEGHMLVLDAGTGLRALGARLGFAPVNMTLCFSHVHWDHIQTAIGGDGGIQPGGGPSAWHRRRRSGSSR